jgi:hypothetical protein
MVQVEREFSVIERARSKFQTSRCFGPPSEQVSVGMVIPQRAKFERHAEWMDLTAIQQYACVSERTVRDWIHLPENPLPAVQVARGKILVKRSQFDIWLQAHPYSSADAVDVDRIVDEVINGIKKVN